MNTQSFGLFVIFVAVSLKLFFDHRKDDYNGPYRLNGSYETISAVKHDMAKAFFIEVALLLAFGLQENIPLFDANNFLASWAGKTSVIVLSFFVFYEFIQPYILAKF